ncbi:DUF3823 domain-containing protein [Flavihumibacter petaseus]|nr:DUF3823 domain-containing protein [Flavihumibacter petaseus]
MKTSFRYIVALSMLASIASCKKDNYDSPSSQLSGRIVYQGEALGFENYQVPFELYQPGYGGSAPIRSSFGQDGSLNALLFDGEYKLVVPNGQGPFVWPKTNGNPDTIAISMKGGKAIDLEVTPYYMIRHQAITVSGTDIVADFGVEQIITGVDGRNIGEVALFVNKTQFVSNAGDSKIIRKIDNVDVVSEQKLPGGAITDPNAIHLVVPIPELEVHQNYLFGRIGVRIDGVEDWLYGPVIKVTY